MMQDLLLIGTFPALAQNLIGTEFRCHPLAAIEHDDALRTSIRAVITRSNYAVLASVIERLPNLGIIATCGVGYDLIPLDVAAQRNVIVTNTPGVLNSAVAELCVGLLFALLRRIGEGDRFVDFRQIGDAHRTTGTHDDVEAARKPGPQAELRDRLLVAAAHVHDRHGRAPDLCDGLLEGSAKRPRAIGIPEFETASHSLLSRGAPAASSDRTSAAIRSSRVPSVLSCRSCS